MHGDDFVAVAEDGQLDHFAGKSSESGGSGPVVPAPAECSSVSSAGKADPILTEKLLNMLNLGGGKGALTLGGKDIGKDDRDVDCELEYSGVKLVQAAAVHRSRPSRHCLQRQDSVTADVEAYEAHAASRGPSR